MAVKKKKKAAKRAAKASARKKAAKRQSKKAGKRSEVSKKSVKKSGKRSAVSKKSVKKSAKKSVKKSGTRKGAKKSAKKQATKRSRTKARGLKRSRTQARGLKRSRARKSEPSPKKRKTRKPAAKKRKLVRIPKPKPAPPQNIYVIRAGDPRGYAEGAAGFEDRVYKPSHFNSHHNLNFDQAFQGFITSYAMRAQAGDPDIIPLFRYGVVFRSENNFRRDEVLEQVRRLESLLKDTIPPNWCVHIVYEGTNITVRVGLGDAAQSRPLSKAAEEMSNNLDGLVFIKQVIEDVTSDVCDWYTFADIPNEWDVESE